MRPLVLVAGDVLEPRPGSVRAEQALAYLTAIDDAGGVPFGLAPLPALLDAALDRADAVLLTGGGDPRTERWGEPTHAEARLVHPLRQTFDEALLAALEQRPELPVLGVCLGMQWLALGAGGRLEQHLPDRLGAAAACHFGVHRVEVSAGIDGLHSGEVASSHHQAVADPGALTAVGWADDGTIEAVVDGRRRFTLGVQWHPERTPDPRTGAGVFQAFLEAARDSRRGR